MATKAVKRRTEIQRRRVADKAPVNDTSSVMLWSSADEAIRIHFNYTDETDNEADWCGCITVCTTRRKLLESGVDLDELASVAHGEPHDEPHKLTFCYREYSILSASAFQELMQREGVEDNECIEFHITPSDH
jgi:hypothetical protein